MNIASPIRRWGIFSPMPTLHSKLNDIAQNFASAVLDAVRGASLQDLHTVGSGVVRNGQKPSRTPSSAPTKRARSSGRLQRRSPEDIANALNKVLTALKGRKEGLRAEQIRGMTGMQAKEMPRILKEGLSRKKLASKGRKRATTYFAK
jgi:hypothetical protein